MIRQCCVRSCMSCNNLCGANVALDCVTYVPLQKLFSLVLEIQMSEKAKQYRLVVEQG